MARQKEYTKSDLSFDDLLRAGLRVPLKDKPAPPPRQPKKPAGKARRKRVDSEP